MHAYHEPLAPTGPHGATRWLGRRALAATATLLLLSFALFMAINEQHADEYEAMARGIVTSCPDAILYDSRQWERGPWYEEYADWLWAAIRGDLGRSFEAPPQFTRPPTDC